MKQKIRSRTSRENIINSASECFTKIGYDQTDVEEICRRANLTKGAFYYHFSSKQDLFLEILDQWINRVAERIDFTSVGTSSILEAIMSIPENFSPLFEEVGNQLPVFLEIYVKSISDPGLKKTILKSHKKFIMFFTGLLKRGIDNKDIRKMDPAEGAEILFAMTMGMLMQGLLKPRSRDWVGLSRKTIKLLLAPE